MNGDDHKKLIAFVLFELRWHHIIYTSLYIFNAHVNKAGCTATRVACGWAGAVLDKVIKASGQEPYAQKAEKNRKSN